MNKKILSLILLLLVISFSTQAFASLTFTNNAITGTTASGIDLGAGNTLSLQTIGNAPITTGTGLMTLGGNLKVAGLTAGSIPVVSTGGLLTNDAGIVSYGDGSIAVNSILGGGLSGGTFIINFGGTGTGISNAQLTAAKPYVFALSSSNTGIEFGVYGKVGNNSIPNDDTSMFWEKASLSSDGVGSITLEPKSAVIGGAANMTTNIKSKGTGTVVVAGGLTLATGSKPSCTTGIRGTTWYVAGASGVKDSFEVCTKDAGNSYAWRVIY